jgi:hypothetical protein
MSDKEDNDDIDFDVESICDDSEDLQSSDNEVEGLPMWGKQTGEFVTSAASGDETLMFYKKYPYTEATLYMGVKSTKTEQSISFGQVIILSNNS